MRIDVDKDGQPFLRGQQCTNDAAWKRIRMAACAGHTLRITRTGGGTSTTPPPASSAPYGTAAQAGELRGRGIMLGSNPDVWDQAKALARQGLVDVVAVIPGTGATFPCRVITWLPPERDPVPVYLTQAENQVQWDEHVAGGDNPGVILNSWTYGKMNGRVAMVEAYYNEGWGVDFGVFHNYTLQGADAVVPLVGGYSAAGRGDAEAAAIYASLAKLPFPGFWAYAGESPLTPETVQVLTRWPVS